MKRKILVVIGMIFVMSFLLTGCFFGSDGSGGSVPEGNVLEADFSMKESSGQLYLNASSTVVEGYSDVEYAWQVNGTNYSGIKVDMTAPNSKTKIKLTVQAHDNNETVTDSTTKTYKPEFTDEDVDFSYSRIGTREYEFVGSKPTGATYWEWKIEGESSWYGYKDKNTYNHQFSSSGNKEVQLRILDSNEEIIGETSKVIDVH